MGSLVNRSVRSVLVLSALALGACSESTGGISGVEPGATVAAKAGGGSPGDATANSYSCSIVAGFYAYQIAPYCTGGPFGGFQSTAGIGPQGNITVTFHSPVNSVTVTARGPDYPGNYMYAYDSYGNFLTYAEFAHDNTRYIESVRTVQYPGIKKVLLIPNPSDYIAYSDYIGY